MRLCVAAHNSQQLQRFQAVPDLERGPGVVVKLDFAACAAGLDRGHELAITVKLAAVDVQDIERAAEHETAAGLCRMKAKFLVAGHSVSPQF